MKKWWKAIIRLFYGELSARSERQKNTRWTGNEGEEMNFAMGVRYILETTGVSKPNSR